MMRSIDSASDSTPRMVPWPLQRGQTMLAGLAERRAQALARHLQQAEAGDAAHLHPGAVHLQRLAQPVLHLALVLGGCHVDEVDDDQAAQVAQAQLAGDLVGRLQVGVERGLLDVAALGGARRVDVDGDQRLGVVDDDGAAGGQAHARWKADSIWLSIW
jgi:hypothetical protein